MAESKFLSAKNQNKNQTSYYPAGPETYYWIARYFPKIKPGTEIKSAQTILRGK